MSETTTQTVERTKPVDAKVFAKHHLAVSNAGGGIADVIAAVAKETGITMTEDNVTVKASSLRKKGWPIGKLKGVGRGRGRSTDADREAFIAMVEAENKAKEAETAETAANTPAA